jgi:hypothetical protein
LAAQSLGEIFTPGPEDKVLSSEGGFQVYEVQPKAPNPAFSIYHVSVVAGTRRIVTVAAMTPPRTSANPQNYDELFEQVRTFLNEKYGGDSTRRLYEFSKNGRKVTLENAVPGRPPFAPKERVRVDYSDETLSRAAIDEAAAARRKKILETFNSTGL